MADIDGVHLLRVAPAASNLQFEADAGTTYVFLEPVGTPQASFKVKKLERDYRRGDNELSPRIVGPKEPPSCNFTVALKGLNANTGGAVTAAKLTDLAPLLDALFGVSANGGTGSTAVSASSTSTVLALADASGIAAGDVIVFNDGTELVGRFVLSKSSNDLTLSHTYSGVPTNLSTAYAGLMWYVDSDAVNHTPVHFDVEGTNWRRKAYGCLGSCSFDFPANGDFARAAFSMQGTHWEDSAEANPSFTAPTCGSEIPCIDGYFSMSSATSGGSTGATATEYLMRDLKVNVTQTNATKPAYSGVNGFAGYVTTKKVVTLESTIYLGALTGEAADSVLNTLQGATAQDLLFQVGRTAGAICLMRMPNADIDAERVIVDGMDAIKITATGARSGFHSTVPGSFQFALI